MIGKKRSVGVTVFGVLILVGGIMGILLNFFNFPGEISYSQNKSLISLRTFLIICHTLLAFSLIYGAGILLLKEWARKMAILINIVALVIYSTLLVAWKIPVNITAATVSMGFPVAILYFFTRPKVKEQFA